MSLPSRRFRRFLLYLFVPLILGLFVSTAMEWPLYKQLSWQLFDLMQRVTGGRTVDSRIVVVGIDDKSFSQEAGIGPRLAEWDRTLYQKLIERLKAAGARVIAFDILFSGEDKLGDQNFAAALDSYPNAFLAVAQNSRGEIIYPSPTLLQTAAHIGHVNIYTEADNVVRSIPLVIQQGEDRFETLGLTALRLYQRLPPMMELIIENGKAQIENGLNVPVDENGHLLTDFSPSHAYIVCSFVDVIHVSGSDQSDCPDALFRDKIVFVGITATGEDLHSTPMGLMYGVEIHANTTASLLNQMALQEQSDLSKRFVIIGIASILGFLAALLRPELLAGGIGLGTILTLFVTFLAYIFAGLKVDMVGPLFMLYAGGGVLLSVQNGTHRAERKELLALFAQQTSPEVLQELLNAADQGELRLGGERRKVTVAFIDMRDYTALSEELAPEEIMQVINAYLNIIAETLIQHDATVSQYAGDQAMALFNAPLEQRDHAFQAVRALSATIEALDQFNRSSEATDLPKRARFGVGINTGDVVVGNIGTAERHNYTAIGDTVNVAARLCGVAPPGAIYIGENTVTSIRDSETISTADKQRLSQILHEINPIEVKGKSQALEVYAINLSSNEFKD